MYALDTNSLSYYLKGKGRVAERLLTEAPSDVGVPSVVVYEIAYGAARTTAPRGLKQRLAAFLRAFPSCPSARRRRGPRRESARTSRQRASRSAPTTC
jgi:tRNA(fMet)-specific endonuclease VapC